MDKLEEIFQMQDALNKRIGVNLPPPTDEEKAKWILNYTRAMQQETAELIDSVPWKWWAKYQKFDEQNAKVEVVDLFHFLVSIAQTLGMTADDVYQAYLKKKRGEPPAAGERLRQKGRGGLEAYLRVGRGLRSVPRVSDRGGEGTRRPTEIDATQRVTTNAACTSTAVWPASMMRARSLSFALP